MKILALSGSLAALLSLAPAAWPSIPDPNEAANHLSRLERDAGWLLLFDGETTAGWRSFKTPEFPEAGWEVTDGCLHHLARGGGGDIMTERAFGDFELEFEWKVAAGANSGVKYRVGGPEVRQSVLGPEYQLLDDAGHPNGTKPKTSAASLYDVLAPGEKQLAPVGEFNRSRIVARGSRIEHWLNGVRVIKTELGSEAWKEAIAASKFAGMASFFATGSGHIALQDHGDEVWFRDLRLRELPGPADREARIYDGKSLAGWRSVGDARYVAEAGGILGEVDGGSQSFLVTEKSYGDFIFEVDVKPEQPGNSGIQIRSHQRDNGRVFGYQIEIDCSDRAWSGGLYDEARRGWLQNLEANPAGRAAFRYQEWNHYRIECVGPWIRTWIDGVPITDYLDTYDVEGFFGLQVHSGKDTKVRWGSPRLWDLGRRSWSPVFDGESTKGWTAGGGNLRVEDGALVAEFADGAPASFHPTEPLHESGDWTLRCRFRIESGDLQLVARGPAAVSDAGKASAVLTRENGRWRIAPALAESFQPGEWNELGLCLDGGRIVVLVNGRLAAEGRGPAGSARDRLTFLQVGEEGRVWLKEIEILGDAVR